jgi:hypothetical protein
LQECLRGLHLHFSDDYINFYDKRILCIIFIISAYSYLVLNCTAFHCSNIFLILDGQISVENSVTRITKFRTFPSPDRTLDISGPLPQLMIKAWKACLWIGTMR